MIELHYYKNTNSIMKWVEVNEVVQIEKTAKFFVNHRETFAGTFLLQRLYCAFFLFFRFFVFFFLHFYRGKFSSTIHFAYFSLTSTNVRSNEISPWT